MAYREYTDSEHVFWRVWEVIPQSIERRRLLDRRLIGRPPERRHRRETRLLLSNGAAQGWLVFESATERRRLRPIPVDWFETSDEALAALGVRATPAGRPSRRLIE
jgi:hypothetical protein